MTTTSSGESDDMQGAAGASNMAQRILALLSAVERNEGRMAFAAAAPSAFEDALLERLEKLTIQLEPLRQLSPQLARLPDQVVLQLQEIRSNLRCPDWTNATRLEPEQVTRRTIFVPGAAGPDYQSS